MSDSHTPPVAPQTMPSADDFCAWLGGALAGDRFEYHRGFLSMDRTAATKRLPDRLRRHLEELADVVMIFAQNHRVHLLQRRLGDDQYSYFAVKSGARP